MNGHVAVNKITPTYYCKYVIFKAEMRTDKQFTSWY